jgi:hypothetical protein
MDEKYSNNRYAISGTYQAVEETKNDLTMDDDVKDIYDIVKNAEL